MTLRVGFDPAALDEIQAAYRWYERESPGVGAEFVAEVWRVIDHAAEWPAAAPLVAGPGRQEGVRHAALHQFPYRIVYLVFDEMLWVVAVAHHRRRPGYWHDRLR